VERHVPRTYCPTFRSCYARHPVELVEHELGGASQRPSVAFLIVPDFVAVSGIAMAAEGKYQVIDEGDLGMGRRRARYFISGSSRLSGELGEYAVEGEQVFESTRETLHDNRFSASRSIEFRCVNGPRERLASEG
jgi:hypothetical protein